MILWILTHRTRQQHTASSFSWGRLTRLHWFTNYRDWKPSNTLFLDIEWPAAWHNVVDGLHKALTHCGCEIDDISIHCVWQLGCFSSPHCAWWALCYSLWDLSLRGRQRCYLWCYWDVSCLDLVTDHSPVSAFPFHIMYNIIYNESFLWRKYWSICMWM